MTWSFLNISMVEAIFTEGRESDTPCPILKMSVTGVFKPRFNNIYFIT